MFEHLRKPHGMVLAAIVLFAVGWGIWTFVMW